MAIAFRSATEAGTGSAAVSLSVSVPSGVQDDDILLLFGVTADGDDGGFDTLTGWTEILDAATFGTGGSAPSPPGMSVWWRVASSEPASYVITPTSGQTGICAQMLAFTGADTTTPIDVTSVTASGDSANANPGSINYSDANATIVCAAFWDATAGVYSAVPSGYTSPDSLGSIIGSGGGNGCEMASAYDLTPGADPEDPGTFTSSAEQWGAPTIALRSVQEGITGVSPEDFDMDEASITISGLNFEVSQGTGTVYISDADTLAGSANEVEIANGINTWSDTSINLDLTGLNATELSNLHTLGPSATRYIIVVNNSSDEYGSDVVRMRRPEAFVTSLGAGTPGATTARLTAPATKTTGDFDAGRFEEAANPATAVDITADDYTEMVWSIEAKTLSREVSYDLRITKNGNVVDTYTVTPQVTISAGATDALTGVSGTSAVGTLLNGARSFLLSGLVATSAIGAVGNSVTVGLSGVSSASAVGSVTESHSGSLPLTGISGTSSVGSVGFTESGNVGITGIEITSNIGDFGISVGGSDALSGIEATSAVGTVDNQTELIPSGVEGTSAEGSLGTHATTALTGTESTAAVGTVQASASGGASITGVEAVSDVGSISFTESGSVGLTGIEGTASVGTVAASAGSTVAATGVEATAEVGSVSFTESGQVAVSGVEATSDVGSVGFTESGSVELSGTEATASVGTVGASAGATTDITGVESTAEVGSVSFTESGQVALSGIEITSDVGDVVVSSGATVALTGIHCTSYAGTLSAPAVTYGDVYNAVEAFPASSSVTIALYDPITGDAISVDDDTCPEITAGVYIWDSTKLTSQPSGYQEYVWKMTDGITVKAGVINMFDQSDSIKLDQILAMTQFQDKVVKNRRKLTKVTGQWHLVVYDDNDSDEIMNKILHDRGNNAIDDVASGVIAEEHKSSV